MNFILIFLFLIITSPSYGNEIEKQGLSPRTSVEAEKHLNIITQQISDLNNERISLIEDRFKITNQILKNSQYKSELIEFNSRNKMYTAYYKASLESNLNLHQDYIKSIQQKRKLSYILLSIVCLMIFAGLAATVWQIKQANDLQKAAETIEMEVEIQKIKVKTSLVGVIILFLSLIFFYIFIQNVYKTPSTKYNDLPTIKAGSEEKE